MRIKKGFTLAEIMIVLTVIAVISAILIPTARQATPNENVMKFKKAHNTLLTAIRELVTSDKYYLNGDLGIKADGTQIDKSHDGDITYFCNTLADVINAKNVDCFTEKYHATYGLLDKDTNFDMYCRGAANEAGTSMKAEILLSNNVRIYQLFPDLPFGFINGSAGRAYSPPSGPVTYPDSNGFDRMCKIVCIDIDEFSEGERPFGYCIRADGKVYIGERAQQWLEKSIQDKDE